MPLLEAVFNLVCALVCAALVLLTMHGMVWCVANAYVWIEERIKNKRATGKWYGW